MRTPNEHKHELRHIAHIKLAQKFIKFGSKLRKREHNLNFILDLWWNGCIIRIPQFFSIVYWTKLWPIEHINKVVYFSKKRRSEMKMGQFLIIY
jgi:hypothetical protein